MHTAVSRLTTTHHYCVLLLFIILLLAINKTSKTGVEIPPGVFKGGNLMSLIQYIIIYDSYGVYSFIHMPTKARDVVLNELIK